MSWINCNTATGNAATGNQYFRRAYVEDQIWSRIKNNQHIIYRAPRRTGKTSILKYMAKNPEQFYKAIYAEIESISTINHDPPAMLHLAQFYYLVNLKLPEA